MPSRDGRYVAAFRGLGLAVLAAATAGAALAVWSAGAALRNLREHAYPIPKDECQKTKDCDQRALKIEAREAVTSDAALDVAVGQLALGVLGLGGLGFTVFYARLAWKESQRSANAAHTALRNHERPWLVVDKVKVEARRFHPTGAPVLPYNNEWYISFEFRNVGRLPAKVEECLLRLVDRSQLPRKPDYTGAGQLGCKSTFAAGESDWTTQIGPSVATDATGTFINYAAVGRLTYRELSGEIHHTGFGVEVSPAFPATSACTEDAYTYHT